MDTPSSAEVAAANRVLSGRAHPPLRARDAIEPNTAVPGSTRKELCRTKPVATCAPSLARATRNDQRSHLVNCASQILCDASHRECNWRSPACTATGIVAPAKRVDMLLTWG